MDNKLFISSSPHVHSGLSTSRIMWSVFGALMPAALWSVWLFGLAAVSVLLVTTLSCVAFEALAQKIAGAPITVSDGSAALTGFLLALTLPPGLAWWICVVGAFVAIIVGKAVFGGLGQNVFNPALTARVFMLIAFPVPLTSWIVPRGTGDALFGQAVTPGVDAITAATPLGLLKQPALGIGALAQDANLGAELFFGNINGSLGEVSALLLIVGGVFLLARRIISWHVPVSYIATVAVFAAVTQLIDPSRYAGALFHVLSGGLMIGAFFMATDYVTSPMHARGKLIFGVGCGVLTMLIRLWAGYPEGVSFAILLMNALVPIIDKHTRPAKFGIARLATAGGR